MTCLKLLSVVCSLLYTNNTCIVFQCKNGSEIEKQILRGFSSLCDWFADNKLSIHFCQKQNMLDLFFSYFRLMVPCLDKIGF